MPSAADIIIEEEDLLYEEEILRNPYSVKSWLRYIEHKENSPAKQLNMVYERALRELPGSYKLWYNYLRIRRSQVKGKCPNHPEFEDANNAHVRALVFMHKMPRIWIDYCKFLVEQKKITKTRRTFDRCLEALPVTQHDRIWPLYIDFVMKYPIHETGVRVFRRMLKLMPEESEEFVDYLKSIDRYDEAATKLAEIVNDEGFASKHGKTTHLLWHELCELISKNPDKVHSLKVEAIIRGGLKRFTDQLGQLWCSLADYYIRSGLFERAREIYEEAIETVTTVRDFTQIFDAYAQFEESVITSKMEEQEDDEEDEIEIELRLARFENLITRRPLLLNSVLLRQNPHNVNEWSKRVELYKDDLAKVINTYTEAIQTIEIPKSVGKIHTLWVSFAKFYEEHDQIDDARTIFEKAILVTYKAVDDLASVWCEWAEMELRHENYDGAITLLKRATAMPPKRAGYFDHDEPVQNRVYRSLKLWSMYADLEESFGTFQTCKAVYDRILDLRIATPQIVINYGMFLEDNNYFEEAFKAYERGVGMFKWPNVFDIWNTYLTKFIARYGGKKLERTRDLFEQALEGCPPKHAKNLYLLYAKLEEEHGLARHAMAVYDRATKSVLPEEKYDMFNIYIKRAAEVYGVTHTRAIYQQAIESLEDHQARDVCLRFADLEQKLGEIDRARAIYAFCSQMCDPRTTADFWQTWKMFEVKHGNEDTVREMLRIKRSVQATYNTQVNFMSAQMLAAASNTTGTAADLVPGDAGADEMKLLEAKAQAASSQKQEKVQPKKGILFIRSDKPPQASAQPMAADNPDEINLDDDDEEEDAAPKGDMVIQKRVVPDQVFGGIKKDSDDED